MTELDPTRSGSNDYLPQSSEGAELIKLLRATEGGEQANYLDAYYKILNDSCLPHLEPEDPLQSVYSAVQEARALASFSNNLISMYEHESMFSGDAASSDERANAQDTYGRLREQLVIGSAPLKNIFITVHSQFAIYVMAKNSDFENSMDTEMYGLNNIRKQLEACGISQIEQHLELLESSVTEGNDREGEKKLSHDADLDNAARAFLVNVAFPRLRTLCATIQERIADIKTAPVEHNYVMQEAVLPGMSSPPTFVKEVNGQGVLVEGNVYHTDKSLWGRGKGSGSTQV